MAAALLFIGGIYHLAFAMFHLFFWRIFKWKISLRLTTPLNRAVMQVMNLCLIFLFVSVSFISFFGRDVLLNESAGKMVLARSASGGVLWGKKAALDPLRHHFSGRIRVVRVVGIGFPFILTFARILSMLFEVSAKREDEWKSSI